MLDSLGEKEPTVQSESQRLAELDLEILGGLPNWGDAYDQAATARVMSGRRIVNTAPPPSAAPTSIVPSWAATSSWLM